MLRKLILLSASLLLAIPAYADLVLYGAVPNSIQTQPGGIYNPTCQNTATLECVIFNGTISFTDDQDYFVDDIGINMDPTNPDGGLLVAGNDNYFQDNVPGLYGPSAGFTSYTGGLFEIDVPLTAPDGLYNGTATLEAYDSLGDPIIGADIIQDFQVDVVPEPSMGILMLFGVASLATVRRRYRPK
jgi:hypothetical protein